MTAVDVIASTISGSLFALGLYYMLSFELQRIVIGFVFLSNGVNVAVLSSSRLRPEARPPILSSVEEIALINEHADPLPQAFVLTAIVIGFGLLAFLLALVWRVQRMASKSGVAEPDS